MRKKVIAGNWKMNMLPNEAINYIEEFSKLVKDSENEIKRKIILPKFIYAPISAGEKVGEIEYYFKDTLVKTSDIFSVADVESYNRKENFQKRFFNNLKVLWNNI